MGLTVSMIIAPIVIIVTLWLALHTWQKGQDMWCTTFIIMALALGTSFVDHTFYNDDLLNKLVEWLRLF